VILPDAEDVPNTNNDDVGLLIMIEGSVMYALASPRLSRATGNVVTDAGATVRKLYDAELYDDEYNR
jgi:hypothetical protein